MATIEQAIPGIEEPPQTEYGTFASGKDTGAVSRFTVASYNIRYAAGPYLISGGLMRKAGLGRNNHRAKKVARNIRTAARAFTRGRILPPVDILALQEADKETLRAGGHHIAKSLAHELEMSWVHVPAGIPRGIPPQKRQWWLDFEEPIELHDQGDTGIALLSHFPIEETTRIDLPWKDCAWRPRLSLGATLKIDAQRVRLFNSHIDPHSAAGGQIAQLEVVLEHASESDDPTILLGDFNTLSPRKCRETKQLLESSGYSTPFPTGTATWRGAGIRLHADWIFVRDLRIIRWGVARPLNVSDHWPIWAQLELA